MGVSLFQLNLSFSRVKSSAVSHSIIIEVLSSQERVKRATKVHLDVALVGERRISVA